MPLMRMSSNSCWVPQIARAPMLWTFGGPADQAVATARRGTMNTKQDFVASAMIAAADSGHCVSYSALRINCESGRNRGPVQGTRSAALCGADQVCHSRPQFAVDCN